MGKKKDKASKSKKKSGIAPVVEAETGSETEVQVETESIQYAEQFTAEDVMELINTLSNDINKLEESNQLLQQQLAQSQKAPHRNHAALKIITIILGIGIIAVGYSSAKISSRMNENMGINSPDMDKMTSRMTTMDTSIQSLASDINKINNSLDMLSAEVTAINQNVNTVASDVSKINTNAASKQQQQTRYMTRPVDPWQRW